jgi:phosphoadenosine phosphosulfate reductase
MTETHLITPEPDAAVTPLVLTTDDKIQSAKTLIADELATFAAEGKTNDIVVTSSFQAEDIIVLHIVRQTLPNVPVVFLDTGYHFAEVYEYRDRISADWSLNLINLLPEITVAEQESQFGILNQTDPGRCCGIRKVGPLFKSLESYKLWFTGMRREQAKSRATMQLAESFKLPSGNHIRKISPLADWTAKDVWAYTTQHGIPMLSLYDKGYSSIGCEPCTSLPLDPNDPRSGRWGGQKQECGIHIQPA